MLKERVSMKRKIIVLLMTAILTVTIPVFAEDKAITPSPGIKPDNPLYILDRLIEKIQLSIITDAVKEAEALAEIAQERLAESKAMVEANNAEKATSAINEYKALMNKAIDVVDTAAKEGKAVARTIDLIAKYDIDNDETLDKLLDKVPSEYKEELEEAIDALPENKKVQAAAPDSILTEKIQDKILLEKIEKAGLNNRQIAVVISLSEQSGKELGEVVDLFLVNSRGIGKTIMELGLAPKTAMKDINNTFKGLKHEIKAGLVKFERSDKDLQRENAEVIEVKDDKEKEDKEKSDFSKMKGKESEKLEKKIEKAAEKLEKKIEQAEKKYENKYKNKKSFKLDHNNDKDDSRED